MVAVLEGCPVERILSSCNVWWENWHIFYGPFYIFSCSRLTWHYYFAVSFGKWLVSGMYVFVLRLHLSRLWNSPPPDVTSAHTLTVFWNRLKTYLFSVAFPS